MGRAPKRNLDAAITELAARQEFVIDRRELRHLGASADAVRYRVALGRLHRVHDGVFATVEPRMLRFEGRCLAAVKACGVGAVVSRRSAAALLDLAPVPSRAIDVTVPRRGTRARGGIAQHTTRRLAEHELTSIDGVPCTRFARTMLDYAAQATERQLKRALEQAQILRIFDRAPLDRALEQANGKKGAATLRALLQSLDPYGPPPTSRELEARFLELIQKAGLPLPVVNGYVEGHQVDFHWPDARLILETDGGETHATPIAFNRDRARDLDLEAAGWHVIRLTWWQVTTEPERVAALLRARLRVL